MSSFRSRVCLAVCVLALPVASACGGSASEPAPASEAPGDGTSLADGGETPTTDDAGETPPSSGTDAGTPTNEPPTIGPVGEWKWIDVPGSSCGYGQQTGFAVNVGTGSELLIYLEGGGVCWDEVTCEVGTSAVTLASFFTSGFDRKTFEKGPPRSGIFDRSLASNPFKNSSIVYVPYCTGDFHSGSTTRWFNTAQKTGHWSGRKNLDLFLEQVVPAFANASRVTLSGSSAGGFGSLINFGHVKELFGSKRVDLISDSGPMLWNKAMVFTGLGTWNTAAALPAGCPECKSNLRELYHYYSVTYPDSRLAITSYDEDQVISLGYTLMPYPNFYDAMHDLTAGTLKSLPNWRYFVAQGREHTMLYRLGTVSQPHCCNRLLGMCFPKTCGTSMTLGDWLTHMETDDPSWKSQSAIIE